jgi:polysaccharide export outer membrane protein
LTDSAARGQITLVRPTPAHSCRIVLPVCYQQIVQHGDTASNYQLAPGDRIYVPASCGWFEFLGLKRKNGCGKPTQPCPLDAPGCATCGRDCAEPNHSPANRE